MLTIFRVAQTVVIALIIGILFTYTLQFFVAIATIMSCVEKQVSNLPFVMEHFYEYVLRIVLVLFICEYCL